MMDLAESRNEWGPQSNPGPPDGNSGKMSKAHETVDRFLETIAGHPRPVVVMHDNPDPDAIASAWCLNYLVRATQQRDLPALAGGAITRAENRHLVSLLQPPIRLTEELPEGAGVVLVDCGIASTNQLASRSAEAFPLAVIDHHQHARETHANVPFMDVRTEIGACASIVAGYLMQRDLQPSVELATAVWYALRTETCAFENHYSPLDREVLVWATTFGSPRILAEIENAPLARSWFSDLALALQSTWQFADTALCLLPSADGVEIVGEVADLLIRAAGIHRVLCGVFLDDALYLSSRTSPAGGNATQLLLETLQGLGSAGGHRHRAGGKISRVEAGGRTARQLIGVLCDNWLTVNGIDGTRGERLVALKDIVENL